MSILDSTIAPFLFVFAGFAVMAGFFRKLLLKVVVILAIEIALFVLFPKLLLAFVSLITRLHGMVH